ncbi:MAG: hypothetical protein RL088_1046 [Verrucomicrobiota bacterium]|jgi:hypothetical protein
MNFFKKGRFEWIQPPVFLRQQASGESQIKKWGIPTMVGSAIGALIGWWFMSQRTGQSFSAFDLAIPAISVGVGTALALRFAESSRSFKVILDEDRLHIFGKQLVKRVYADIAAFEWQTNADCATLSLHHRDKKAPLLIGVPLDISREEVSAFLSEKGIAPKTP